MPTVFTKPGCQQCIAVKRNLDGRGIAYETVDVTQDEAAMQHVKELGYLALPVVEYNGTSFSGFNPTALASIPKV